MRTIVITCVLTVVLCMAAAAQQNPSAPVAPARDGLGDLNAVTFSCPKAGLNAAARRAAKVPSQGTYQFSYFKIVNDTHHAAYEVHFKSNYDGETDLRYCVEMYCQQGWDPKTSKMSVTLMSTQRAGVKTHGAACGGHQAPASHRAK
jgi:hypothetical protein